MKEMQSGNSKETEVEEKEKKKWTQEKNDIQSEGANGKIGRASCRERV